MFARRFAIPIALLLAVAGIGAALYAQLETGDRGILPLDSSGTLEIGGIHVDVVVGGKGVDLVDEHAVGLRGGVFCFDGDHQAGGAGLLYCFAAN